MTKEESAGAREVYHGVTLVTGHKDKHDWTILAELGIYWAALYYVTHPESGDKVRTKLRPVRIWLQHRISVWRAREAIHALPETDANE